MPAFEGMGFIGHDNLRQEYKSMEMHYTRKK